MRRKQSFFYIKIDLNMLARFFCYETCDELKSIHCIPQQWQRDEQDEKGINEIFAVPEMHTFGGSALLEEQEQLLPAQLPRQLCFAVLPPSPSNNHNSVWYFGNSKAHRIPERTDKQLFSLLKWMNYWTPPL